MWINLTVKEETFKKYLKDLNIKSKIINFKELINQIKNQVLIDSIGLKDYQISEIIKTGSKLKISEEYFLSLCLRGLFFKHLQIISIKIDKFYNEISEKIQAIESINIKRIRDETYNKFITNEYTLPQILLAREIVISDKIFEKNINRMNDYIVEKASNKLEIYILILGFKYKIVKRHYFKVILKFSTNFWNI